MSKLRLFYKRLGIVVVACVFVAPSLSLNVLAFSDEFDEEFYSGNNITFYDPSACPANSTAAASTDILYRPPRLEVMKFTQYTSMTQAAGNFMVQTMILRTVSMGSRLHIGAIFTLLILI